MDPERLPLLPNEIHLPDARDGQTYKRRLYSFLTYTAACEIYSVVALSFFVPVCLEQFARDNGKSISDHSKPCISACEAFVLFGWVNTASFSLFTFSTSVAILAILLVSIGNYADSLTNRRRLLLNSALLGSSAGIVFFFFPSSSNVWFLASLLAIIGGVCFGLNIVCLNSALPYLGRKSPAAQTALKQLKDNKSEEASYHKAVARETARISAEGLALGYGAGLIMLALCLIPLKVLKGSTASLRIAIGTASSCWGVLALVGASLRS